MATACGIKVAINGSTTDTDVEADAATWVSKVGGVRITGGGGSWLRQPRPFTLHLDVAVPMEVAHKIRTATIGLTLEATTLSTLPAGTIAGSPPYRIVFNGTVAQMRGALPGEWVGIDFVEDVQNYLSRNADVAALPTSGIRDLLDAIETAHGDTIAGNDQFPSSADFPDIDMPAQNGTTNGAMIRTALAGTGINISSEWTGSMTAPEFRWRPDYFDSVYSASVSTTRQWTWEAGYPWLLNYGNTGILYNDFVSKIIVDGIDSSSVARRGWARLSDATYRNLLGKRELNIRTWMDTAANLETAARRMLAFQGEPNYTHIYQMTVPIEPLYQTYLNEGAADAEIEVFTVAALHPGDLVVPRNPWNDTHTDYGNWPADTPYGGTVGDSLNALWIPSVTDNGNGTIVVEHIVRTITREYTAQNGWTVTYGMDPHGAQGGLVGADVASHGSSTWAGTTTVADFWTGPNPYAWPSGGAGVSTFSRPRAN